jgi:glutamyl-tRNA synthetase
MKGFDDPKFTDNIRVRFAPSPTGWMHIGSIRQIIYNYLWARKFKGAFVLRIEDTDVERTVEGGIDSIYELFDAFGIDVDEGPKQGGGYGPYVQSQRLDLYKKYADELVSKGAAYYCFCSEERLASLRERQKTAKLQPKYDGACRELPVEEVQERVAHKEPYVVRLKVPRTGVTEYDDVIHGRITFKNSVIDDQIILKSDGFPTYHFAAVVDDHLMKISHIIRGEEYLSSAPKIVLMYQALGWEIPYLIQAPNVLNPDGKKKLSKRGGSNTAHKFLRKGYLIEALWNFLVLLGWSPTGSESNRDEIYSKDDLMKLFDVRRIQKSGARFMPEKLDHFNRYYIRNLSIDDFAQRIFAWAERFVLKDLITDQFVELEPWEKDLRASLETYMPMWKKDKKVFKKTLSLIQERVQYLSEVPDLLCFIYDASLEYEKADFETLAYKKQAEALEAVWEKLKPVVQTGWKQETWEKTIRESADSLEWKQGDLFMLIRIAVTGRRASPPLFECMELMGVDRCNELIQNAVKFLSV